ncbi:MAG TPA: aldo/keto reductase [Steroidobacteraceae bacterium]|nr:aldo/keto reductase [Steroidobacteraceae bacterium]
MTGSAGGPCSRRDVLELSVLAGASLALPRSIAAADEVSQDGALITRAIPVTGERLPVVGLGTNNYSVTGADELALRREVLKRMPDLGGSVVDTAPAYGQSEAVLGDLMAGLGNRDRLFLATKVTAPDDDTAQAKASFDESLRRLRTDRIDLLQVHSLVGTDALMPLLGDWKAAKKIRYFGITTSNRSAHAEMLELMRRHTLDFIQVDYSLDNRAAAADILPLAQERRVAVLINLPLGGRRGGSLLSRVANRELPEWATRVGATSWAQLFLKYVISHPAVTCVIPGTTKPNHLEDNQRAARGALPDAALRQRIEHYWDGLA